MSVFPSKVNFVTGDILTATDVNEIGQAINLLDGAQLSGAKNRVLNSNFSVWQRGTTFTGSFLTTYTADRWVAYVGAGSNTISRQVTGDTTNLPFIQYCTRFQRDSGQTGVLTHYYANGFETVNSIPLAGKTVTISFYARAGANYSSASNALLANVITGTGTDQNVISGLTGGVNAISQTATLTTTWQRFSYTGTLAANATQVAVRFDRTPVGTAGANDYYEITGVQLEVANTASPYAPNGATYQAELAACQRYYYRFTGIPTNFAIASMGNDASTASAGQAALKLPVTMRTTPTAFDTAGTWYYAAFAGGSVTLTGLTLNASTNADMGVISVTSAAAFNNAAKYQLLANNSTASYIGFSAEL